MKIHLDTDIGGDIDDAYALAYLARHSDAELVGITTVLDDDGRRAGYTRELLRIADASEGVPIAEGAREDHPRYRGQSFGLPDESRYWPTPVEPAPGPLDAALDLLVASIALDATILAIGPLTNLALLEEREPGILGRARLVVMGGFVHAIPEAYPQFKWTDDFNVQADADAARTVLEAVDPARSTLVPLEVTIQTYVRTRDVARLAAGDPLAALLARQAEASRHDLEFDRLFGRRHAGLPDDVVNFMHDPLAAAVSLGWQGATIATVPVRLEESGDYLRTIEDPAGRQFPVVTEVNAAAFLDHWLEVVAPIS